MRLLLALVSIATVGLVGCKGESETSSGPAAPSTQIAPAGVAPGIPTLAARAASAASFAPMGWRVEQQVSGDISGDGVADLAFVLRKTDPAMIVRREGYEPENINPRLLAVALGSTDGFVLSAQDHALIPSRDADTLNMNDPFDGGLSIADGALTVEVNLFMSMGGGSTGPFQFRFRHQDGAVRLIGYDNTIVERMSGEMTTVSVNFLTGRRTDTKGRIDSEVEETVVSRIHVGPLPLGQVGDAFAFDNDKLRPVSRSPHRP